nr:PTS glucose transporter subunit IIA [Liquorilactobacillus nagelii]
MELIPVKYCVTIEIRNSKLNLVIVKPPRLLSNLGGSLQEILIHMGLDTVELEGDPFEIKVSQGQKVNKNQLIAKMNLKKIEAKEKKNTVIVVYTNMELLRSISEVPSGNIKHGEKVQKIRLKK